MPAAVLTSGSLINASSVASPVTTGTLGFTPTEGNVLYVLFRIGGNAGGAALTVSDSINGAYTALGTLGDRSTIHEQWFKVTVATATAPTFTLSWTGGNANWLIIPVEVSDSNGEDAIGVAGFGTGTAPIAGAVVGTQTDLLLVGYASGSTTWNTPLDNVAGNAMTIIQPSSGSLSGNVSVLASEPAASYTPQITMGTSNLWLAMALLIKDASGIAGSAVGAAGASTQCVGVKAATSTAIGTAGAFGQNVQQTTPLREVEWAVQLQRSRWQYGPPVQ